MEKSEAVESKPERWQSKTGPTVAGLEIQEVVVINQEIQLVSRKWKTQENRFSFRLQKQPTAP